ncbi:MAG: HAMP domain-containing histidine kinase [Actinobacteria bacterium]|nr:HAMP domain-containing histidine kinase [Actinomycetota bacterium]
MNLRSIRIRLTLVYGILSAVAIAGLSYYADDAGRNSIYASAEREALANAQEAALDRSGVNAWFVAISDEDAGYEEAFGETWIEPPLQTITREGLWYDDQFSVHVQDERYLGAVVPLDEEAAAVAFIELTSFDDEASSLRLRIVLAGIGAVLAVAVAGWVVAGRSLRPTRVVLAQQRDFIADAAHELRTPLAVIQASATQSLARPREANDYRNALVEIAGAADRASSGVNELLEFARLEAGQALPRLSPLRLDFLVEEVAASVRIDSTEIVADVAEQVVIQADYNLLRQAAITIVNNAGARADRVWVGAKVEGRRGVLIVSDDGPGFTDDALEHLFDRFHRGDRMGSTGLGMAIAQKIVQVHGGEIVAGNGDSGGAVVRMEIPLAAATDR